MAPHPSLGWWPRKRSLTDLESDRCRSPLTFLGCDERSVGVEQRDKGIGILTPETFTFDPTTPLQGVDLRK